MKKRIVCALLGIVTLLALMAGCSQENGDYSDTSRYAYTLSMWIVTEDETTAAAQAEVEAAFNEITEADYTTHVDIIFCTMDEYKEALNAQFELIDSKPSSEKAPVILSNETYRDEETGMLRVKYPELWKYQMDIVLITDQNMLNEFVDDRRVVDLTTHLNTTNKTIKTFVNSDIMNKAAFETGSGSDKVQKWYAVPNNSMIGEYTFMLVNKTLANKYYYNPDKFTSFGTGTPIAEFIEEIAEKEPNVVPVGGIADYPLVKYWSQNQDAASVLATMYASSNMEVGGSVTAVNLFADDKYKSYMELMFHCKEQGYLMGADDMGKDFGVTVMDGDYSVYQEYGEDYYVIPLAYPRLEDTEVFDSMFAVSAYTVSEERSMEIIQALTCESELRNVLQYGVEGVHYELDDNGVVKRLNRNYMMNVNYTGNAFKAYPEEGMTPNVWKNIAMEQNKHAMLSIVFGTTPYLNSVDKDAWQKMSEVSVSYFERLSKCETVSEFNTFLDVAKTEVASSDYYKKLTTYLSGTSNDLTALNGALQEWWYQCYSKNQ